MSTRTNPLKANISRVYAISLTQAQKKQLIRRIHRDIHQRNVLSEENVRVTCNYLNQCFESQVGSVLLAMEIITKLLSLRVAEHQVIQSYRKLLTYVSSTLDVDSSGMFAICFDRITTVALQNENISSERFPVSMVKCILMLIYRLPVVNSSDRNAILNALRSTLQWCKREPKLYKQCGFGSLIRCAIASTSHLQDDPVAVTELTLLARHILDVFYMPHTSEVHPVEILLRSTYDKIFTRLVSEWTDIKCYELLLYVLFDVLKRDLYTYLKLDIVRALADAAGGGMRRLVRLLCVPKHLRDEHLLRKLRTILTIVLGHSLFRYEPTKRAPHFRAFLKTIEKMINGVDFALLLNAQFFSLKLPRAQLTIECVSFVFVLRHLDLLDGVTSRNTELDYLYNLIASVNIVYHKRWKLPSFLVKHFIDGLSRFSGSDTFQKNVSDPAIKVKTILSTSAGSLQVKEAVANIFGRLPTTVQRIRWIQMQPDDFRAKFIFHQQQEILQERYIAPGDDGLVHSLLTILQTDTLLTVLSASNSTAMARRNASVLLSKCCLTGAALEKVLQRIKPSQRQARPANPGMICNWVRAIYGSVGGLNNRSKLRLWRALPLTSSCSDEQSLLLVDTRVCLLVSMMREMKGQVIEMHLDEPRSKKTS